MPSRRYKSIIICTTPRSGSSFFADALAQTGVLGNPAEWTHDYLLIPALEKAGLDPSGAALDPHAAIRALHQRAAVDHNTPFALKTMRFEFSNFLERLGCSDPESRRALVRELLHDPLVIFWHRDDFLRQAISMEKAHQTGIWHSDNLAETTPPPSDELFLAIPRIEWIQGLLKTQEEEWRQIFAELAWEPWELSYQDLMRDYKGTIKQVVQRFGRHPQCIPSRAENPRKPIGDEVNRHWSDLYHEVAAKGVLEAPTKQNGHWINHARNLWITPAFERSTATAGSICSLRFRIHHFRGDGVSLAPPSNPRAPVELRAYRTPRYNGLMHRCIARCRVPASFEPGEGFEGELQLPVTEHLRTRDIYLLLCTKERTWVQLLGINTPRIRIDPA